MAYKRKNGFTGIVALTGVALLALSACSGSKDDGGMSLLTSGDADVTKGQGLALTQIIENFEEATDTEVELMRVPFDQYLSAATTRARAGTLSDVVEMLPGENHSSIFDSLNDLSVSEFVDGDKLSGWESTLKSADDASVYAGVPVGAQGVVWYYNKQLFEDAGLDPEQPPATWDEMMSMCDTFNENDITAIGMSGGDSFIIWWAWSSLSPQFFSAEDVNAVRGGDISLTDQRFADSLQPLLESYERGCWNDDYAGKNFTDIESAFASGEIAIVPGIISNAMNWAVWDDNLGKDGYGVFKAPNVSGATLDGQFFNPVLMYGINKDTKDLDAARALIEELTSVAGQEIQLREASQFPNRTDVDVEAITGSVGAGSILQIVEEVGGVDVAQNQFNGAAQDTSWSKLTQTMESGDIDGFLADIENQQRN